MGCVSLLSRAASAYLAGRRCRTAIDEVGNEGRDLGRHIARQAGQQVACREAPDLSVGHARGGQWRIDLGGHRHVVEAGDGKLARYLQAHRPRFQQRADGEVVVSTDHRGRARRRRPDLNKLKLNLMKNLIFVHAPAVTPCSLLKPLRRSLSPLTKSLNSLAFRISSRLCRCRSL